jgi:hypothetical protein
VTPPLPSKSKTPPPSPPSVSFSRSWAPNIAATAAAMNNPYAVA